MKCLKEIDPVDFLGADDLASLSLDYISSRPEMKFPAAIPDGLSRLFPELDPMDFNQNYLGKKYYHSKKNQWHKAYSAEDFMKDLSSATFDAKDVSYSYDSTPVQHEHDMKIAGKDIEGLLKNKENFSFRISPLLKYSQKADALLRNIESLEATFGSEVGHVTFFSKDNQSVIPRHWDTEDLLIFQLQGRKKWHFHKSYFQKPLRQHTFGFMPHLCQFDEASHEEIVMEEGDALYLPKGLGHFAQSIGGDSLHITYGIYQPSVFDLTEHIVKQGMHIFSLTSEARHFFNASEESTFDTGPALKKLFEICSQISPESFLKNWPLQSRLHQQERFSKVMELVPEKKDSYQLSGLRSKLIRKNDDLLLRAYGRLFLVDKVSETVFMNELEKASLSRSKLIDHYGAEVAHYFIDAVTKLRIFI